MTVPKVVVGRWCKAMVGLPPTTKEDETRRSPSVYLSTYHHAPEQSTECPPFFNPSKQCTTKNAPSGSVAPSPSSNRARSRLRSPSWPIPSSSPSCGVEGGMEEEEESGGGSAAVKCRTHGGVYECEIVHQCMLPYSESSCKCCYTCVCRLPTTRRLSPRARLGVSSEEARVVGVEEEDRKGPHNGRVLDEGEHLFKYSACVCMWVMCVRVPMRIGHKKDNVS